LKALFGSQNAETYENMSLMNPLLLCSRQQLASYCLPGEQLALRGVGERCVWALCSLDGRAAELVALVPRLNAHSAGMGLKPVHTGEGYAQAMRMGLTRSPMRWDSTCLDPCAARVFASHTEMYDLVVDPYGNEQSGCRFRLFPKQIG
jgi:hypothetical protein